MAHHEFAAATRNAALIGTLSSALALAAPVPGGTVVFDGTGWQAEWNASLDGLVDIDFIDVIGNTIFIQKAAEFTQPSSDGKFTPIVITFRQTGPSTIDAFVIDDEIIVNSTGEDWSGFCFKLNNGTSAAFNPAMTAASGGGGPIGFSIDPFTKAVFLEENRKLRINGGVLAADEVWFPGGGGDDGQLWINVQSGGPGDFRVFNLREQPIPVAGPPQAPVCVEVVPPSEPPECGSSGNPLLAVVNNVTPTTTFDWEVVSGACVIQSGDGSTSITYSIPDTCPEESCCLFRFTIDDPGDASPPSVCEHEVCCECPPPPVGGEGRTPGFWKQPHHFGHWPAPYCPSSTCGCTPTLFCEVFDCNPSRAAYEGKTLLQVLQQGGGGFKALGRHAVGALLNSASDGLDFGFTTQEVINLVNAAIDSGNPQSAHAMLEDQNEMGGGSLGGQSHCGEAAMLDGTVDNHDLQVLLGNWGQSGAGDVDGDGLVGPRDLILLLSHWGSE
jgi:hypothetical protein